MKRPPKVYHRTLRTLRNVLLALLALWLWWASQGYPALTPRQPLRWQEQVHMAEKVDYLDTLPVGLKDKDRLVLAEEKDLLEVCVAQKVGFLRWSGRNLVRYHREQELQVVPVMWEDNLEGSLLLFSWAPEGTHRVEGVLTDTRYDEPVQVFFEGEEKMGSLFLCQGERPTEEEWLGFFFDLNRPQDLSYQQRTLRYQIEVRAYDQGGNLLAESSYGV